MTDGQRDRVEGTVSYMDADEMRNIEDKMDEMNLDVDAFDDDQLGQIVNGLADLSADAVSMYADPGLDGEQMYVIREGLFDDAISRVEVESYADDRFDADQMRVILEGFQDDSLSDNEVAIYINPEYDSGHMYEALYGLQDGMSQQEVEAYLADPELTREDIESVRQSVYAGADVNEAIDVVKTASGVMADITSGDVDINSISRWDVDSETANPDHDYNFRDVYYSVETDKGNFEIRVALMDGDNEPSPDNIDRISIRVDTGSLDGGHDSWFEGSMTLFEGASWEKGQEGYEKACALLDAVNSHDVDEEDIHEISINEDKDEFGNFSFDYSIDGQTIFVSDYFSGSMDRNDTIARFCEGNKEMVLNAVEDCRENNVLYGQDYEEFKGTIQDAEIIDSLPDDYKAEHMEAMIYIEDAHIGYPSGAENAEEYMAKIDSIESCGVLDEINNTVENLKDALEESGEASYECGSLGYEREIIVSGNDSDGWKLFDDGRENDYDSEEEALNHATSVIEYDYACDVGIPEEYRDEDLVDQDNEEQIEAEEEQFDPDDDSDPID